MSSDWGNIGKINVSSYKVAGSAASVAADNMDTYFGDDPDYSTLIEEDVTSNAELSSEEIPEDDNQVFDKFVNVLNAQNNIGELLEIDLFSGCTLPSEAKTTSTFYWVLGKDALTNAITSFTGAHPITAVLSIFALPLFEGLYKGHLSETWEGKNATSYAWGYGAKGLISGLSKSKDSFVSLYKWIGTKISPPTSASGDAVEVLIEQAGDNVDDLFDIQNMDEALCGIKTATGITSVTSIVSKLGFDIGIDYVGSLAANVIIGSIEKGELDLSVGTLKPGSTFLKSSTKKITETAFSLIGGAIGGKAGAKAGKLLGTIVGILVGEIQVASFTTYDENGNAVIHEGWCAAAGALQIVGAVVCVVLYAFLASNPVGWVAGLVILAGAAVGYLFTKLLFEISQIDWGAVLDAVGDAIAATGELICAIGQEIVEFAGEVYEATVEFVGEVIDVAEEFVETACEVITEAYESAVEVVEDVISYVEDVLEDVPVLQYLFSW